MKTVGVLVAMATLSLLVAATAFVDPEYRGSISWSRTCGGVGTLRNLSLSDCSAQNCSVWLDATYAGSITLSLGSNHSSLLVNVDAAGNRNLTLYTYSYRGNYTRGSNVTLPYTVRFIRNLFTNRTGSYNVQVSVQDGSTKEICREFGVQLV